MGRAGSVLLAKFIVYQTVLALYSAAVLVFEYRNFSENIPGFMGLALLGFVVNFAVVVVLYCVGFFPRITGSFFESCLYILGRLRLVRDPEAAGRRVASEIEAFHGGFTELRREGGLLLRFERAHGGAAHRLLPGALLCAPGAGAERYGPAGCDRCGGLHPDGSPPLCRCPGLPAGRRGASSSSSGCSSGGAGAYSVALLLWRLFTFYLPIVVGAVFVRHLSQPGRRQQEAHPAAVAVRQGGAGEFSTGVGRGIFPPAECPPGRGLSCGKGRSFPRIPQTFPPEFVESSKKLSPEQMQESGIFSCKIEKPLDFGRRKAYIDTIEAAVLLQHSWL